MKLKSRGNITMIIGLIIQHFTLGIISESLKPYELMCVIHQKKSFISDIPSLMGLIRQQNCFIFKISFLMWNFQLVLIY